MTAAHSSGGSEARRDISRDKWLTWSDALGLAAFAVQGNLVAIHAETPAIVLGTMTAVGGGVVRDVLSDQRPMIFGGQLHASTALLGVAVVVLLSRADAAEAFRRRHPAADTMRLGLCH